MTELAKLINRAVYLAQRAKGLPGRETWDIHDSSVRPPDDAEILVGVQYVSMDPAMRGWIENVPSYVEPVEIGRVMRAQAVGRVIESRSKDFHPGDCVCGPMGVQLFWTGIPEPGRFFKIDPDVAPLERYLGALGITGITAYFGLLDVGRLRPGDTLVVSGAAGAVGGLVGQIARIKGAARVVGIAGGPAKCAYVTDELGFDACLDYKAGNLIRMMRSEIPGGMDVLFDNVGGDALECGLRFLKRGARVVLCGAIASYNDPASMRGPRTYFNLALQRATMAGLIAYDYVERYDEALRELRRWISDGSLKAREQIEQGIDRFPEVFQMLFYGGNTGKLVLKVA